MKKITPVLLLALIVSGLPGCVMDLNQPSSATPFADPLSPAPSTGVPNTDQAAPSTSSTIPITWAALNLSGRLVYSTVSAEDGVYISRIQMLDLGTGGINTIYTSEGNGWIYYLTVSTDANELIMSYTTPAQAGVESISSLYVLPLEEAASPQILVASPTSFDRYVQVEWSPDRKYVYYAYYNQNDQAAGQAYPEYQIFRMAYPNGQPEKIIEHAFWPRVSADSLELVYVTLDPTSGFSKLLVANADGSNPREILVSGLPSEIMDAPIFSPDGQSILFSAPIPPQAYQPHWLERLTGVQVARAHNVPSDWWSVPITGGAVTRLTQIQSINLFASISPDGKHIASVSGEGLFVMKPDGSNLTRLLLDPEVSGVVNWLP